MWFEELPEQCPPADSIKCCGEYYYRLIENIDSPIDSLISLRTEFPKKVFPVDECQIRSVSIFKNLNDCQSVNKLPRHKHKTIFTLYLKDGDGVVKKTQKHSHYSWWRSRTFTLEIDEAV